MLDDFDDLTEDTYAGDPSERMEKIAREARERVSETMEYESKAREERQVARDFIEGHYDDEELEARRQTKRPAMELHLIESRAQDILHDNRKSGAGFRIGSATSQVGNEAAAALHGLAVRDQRDSFSEAEMEKICHEMVLYGLGVGKWMIVDEDGLQGGEGHLFSDTAGEMSEALSLGAFDKRLKMVACDTEDVYADPRDTSPDKSQMAYLIEVETMTLEERNRRYPLAAKKKLPASVFDADFEDSSFWFASNRTGPTRDREVRIATYYKRYTEKVDFVWVPAWGKARRADRLSAQEQSEFTAAEAAGKGSRYPKEVSYIKMHVTDGMFELQEPFRLPFKRIPYFFATGPVYTFTDGQRVPRGLVHQMRDTVLGMDLTISDMAFKMSIAGQDGWVGAAESIRGHANDWKDTTRPKSIRLYNQYSTLPGPGGERLQLTAPTYHSSQPAIVSSVGAMGVQRELLGMQTGAADPQSRDTTNQLRSAAALKRLDEMTASSRTTFLFNLEKVTYRAMGETWLEMARFVYDRPGRLVVVSAGQSNAPDEGWLIGIPFIRDLTTGKPIPLPDLPENVTRIPNRSNPEMMDTVYRFNPPTDAAHVTTFSMALTKAGRESMIEWLMSLAGLSPTLTPLLAPEVFEAAEDIVPAAGNIAKRIRATMPTPPEDPTDAAQAPSLVAVLQQQMQQAQQQIQELQKKAAPAEAAREVAERNAAKDIEIAKLRAQVDVYKANLQADVKRDELSVKSAMDYDKADADRDQKRESAILDAAIKFDTAAKPQGGDSGRRGGNPD